MVLPGARRPSRPRRIATALGLSVALAFQVAVGSGTASATPSGLHSLINDARGSAGLGGLALNDRLSQIADEHSLRMAREGRLAHHDCLGCTYKGGGWQIMGENVGAGAGIAAVHREMMESPAHRENILRKGFDRVGIGITRANGLVWVTEIFAG